MTSNLFLSLIVSAHITSGFTIKMPIYPVNTGPDEIFIFDEPPSIKPLEPIAAPNIELKAEIPLEKPVETPEVPQQAILNGADVEAIKAAITHWAGVYGVSSSLLLRIANCESGYNPRAVNKGYYAGGGHPSGLFQYIPDTWSRYSSKLGKPGYDIWNYQHQAEVTAYAFSIGGASEWECR